MRRNTRRDGSAEWTSAFVHADGASFVGDGVPIATDRCPTHKSSCEAMALTIHLVAHIARVDGGSQLTQLIAIDGYDGVFDTFQFNTLYPVSAATGVRA